LRLTYSTSGLIHLTTFAAIFFFFYVRRPLVSTLLAGAIIASLVSIRSCGSIAGWKAGVFSGLFWCAFICFYAIALSMQCFGTNFLTGTIRDALILISFLIGGWFGGLIMKGGVGSKNSADEKSKGWGSCAGGAARGQSRDSGFKRP